MRCRGLVLAVLFGAVASSAPAADADWKAEIFANSWAKAQESESVVQFLKPAKPPNTIWVRYENRDGSPWGASRYLSSVSLIEYDCLQWRIRTRQSSVFSERNLQGPPLLPGGGETAWNFPVPDTFNEFILNVRCASPKGR